MIINSRSSNFLFTFPKGFFTKSIIEKYAPYVFRNPLPYDTLENLMAAQIQSVTFPTITMDPVQQTRNRGKKQEYKNSVPVADLFTREVQVTMKTLNGYINYWIFLDNMLEYLNFQDPSKDQYFDDLAMRFLDQEGYVVVTTQYKGVYFKGMTEITASYSDNNPDFKTFTATFGFFEMKILIDHD
jgi:hypothetical protein